MNKRLLLLLLLLPLGLMAQKITPEEYIKTYKDIAMKEMKKHKIPASITLAQGLLESGAGNSKLARKAKNHFGIKCHKDWKGRKFKMDDDERNECFRRYRKAEDSFKDHSKFLTSRPRYASLFELDIMDYEGWARGLKAAGYATNPKYAQLLIDRIELYHLDKYDKIAMGLITEKQAEKLEKEGWNKEDFGPERAFSPTDRSVYEVVDVTEDGRFIYENNHVKFVFAQGGETPRSIAKEFHIRKRKVYRYNLLKHPENVVFRNGDVVYIEALRNRNRKAKSHIVVQGETLRDVALRYAVNPEKIAKKNRLEKGAKLWGGQKLKLR